MDRIPNRDDSSRMICVRNNQTGIFCFLIIIMAGTAKLADRRRPSQLRVNRVVSAMSAMSPLYPQEPTSSVGPATSETCHVRTSPVLSARSEAPRHRSKRRDRHHSLNVGSVHPPQTQGKVQSAVRLALSGMYLLQASARTGLIDCQMTSKVPEEFILPIMTGLER